MLKFIIIAVLFIYVVYKASDFVLRMIDSVTGGGRRVNNTNGRGRSFGPEHRRQQQSRYRQSKNGNVNIDYVPKEQTKKRSASEGFKGGDYVDYEDVK
ncbi:DUF4834 family protein [Tunicatimonas pelagia]|uniref:DUF4834 family protein n=1 Tax=Tunicatimonas pelagia TaxID=931531 RepID=UPI0026662D6C|nr:DUF4834 family protein [Tunicatimonas pelagia]WKN45710.1 DUF4834 family protein [Tunicatimonas pelagia]